MIFKTTKEALKNRRKGKSMDHILWILLGIFLIVFVGVPIAYAIMDSGDSLSGCTMLHNVIADATDGALELC